MATENDNAYFEQLASDLEKFRADIREKLEDVLKFRIQADQDARQAAQAKGHTEDHANQIAKLKGTAEVDASAIATLKKNSDETYQAILAARPKVQADLEAVAKAMDEIKADQQRIDENERAIEDLKTQLAELRDKSKVHQDNLSLNVKTADAALAKISSSEDVAREKSTLIEAASDEWKELLVKASVTMKSLDENHESSKAKLTEMAGFIELSDKTMGKVTEYQNKLTELQKAFESTLTKIETLLPGATSSGLAASFMEQKKRFNKPKWTWLIIFILSILSLIFLALFGVTGHINNTNEQWDVILRFLVQRLPVVVPLVWLAIYAGRQYTIAARIEEDYAYKEALSRAFEGYKREMSNIPNKVGSADALNVLCVHVLGALAERPGRIYEAEHDDATPVQSATYALANMLEKTKGKPEIRTLTGEVSQAP